MATLVHQLYDELQGADINTRPRLPLVVTVHGVDLRVSAETYRRFPDGTSMSSWDDTSTGSGAKLTPEKTDIAGATKPTLSTVDGRRVVSFNGTTDATGINYNTAEPFTITMLFKLPEVVTNAFLLTTLGSGSAFKGLGVEGGGLIKWWGAGIVTGPALTAGWHIVTIVSDGLLTTLRLDDVVTGGATAGTAYTRAKLNIGGSAHSTRRTRMDVAEVINWPRPLTAAEVDQMHKSIKTRYWL